MPETRPYVGPRPYQEQEGPAFFGREREGDDLLFLVIAHSEVLLCGPSGAGRTSPIRARLIPLASEFGFQVLPVVRFAHQSRDISEGDPLDNYHVSAAIPSLLPEYAPDPGGLHRLSLAEYLHRCPRPTDEVDQPVPRLIIFDQFEELFTTRSDRWRDREGLFRQVGAALADDRLLRVVFSLRETFIGELDRFAPLLPERLQTRYRLERLRFEPAVRAITEPLAHFGRSMAPGVAEGIVRDLIQIAVPDPEGGTMITDGEFVEPVQLQVVCHALYDRLPPDSPIVEMAEVERPGDTDRALSSYYEKAVATAASQGLVDEAAVRNWFEHALITPAGTRGAVLREGDEVGGLPNAVAESLEDLHLIRGEERAGARWYELAHDRFIGPIRDSNRFWRAERAAESGRPPEDSRTSPT